ncbi:MAG: hypothetical protein AB8B82_17150 [Roseovarius sp.]
MLILAMLGLPMTAGAETRDITPMASYCVEALVDSRPLMTSALIPTTAKAVGRDDADERVEFFTVPHEDLVFSRLDVSGLSACTVFLQVGAVKWDKASVENHFEKLGMITGEACQHEGQAFWFATLKTLRGKGVTAVMEVDGETVTEILAFETPELTRPGACQPEDAE